MRDVECVLRRNGGGGALSAHCDPYTKPPAMQSCTTGIPCNKYDVGGFQSLLLLVFGLSLFCSPHRTTSILHEGSIRGIPDERSVLSAYLSPPQQLKQHEPSGNGYENEDDDIDAMEDDEPFAEPQTLPLTQQDLKPKRGGFLSDTKQKIPNEAT